MNLQGLNKQQVEESRQKHGANTLTQIPPEPLWKKILEGFKDPMIMILLVALVIQVVLCFMGEAHWYEPVGILIAIMIANGVSAISENQQEGKASALKAEEEAKEVAKVLRDGKLMEIHVSEVVVGDLVYLQAGDKISADGEIVEGLVKVDQATLNGETKEATKTVNESGEAYNTKDLLNRCYVYRGTVVCSGEAYMEVKVVGDKTLFGELALEVQEDTRETPLQVKLAKLAKQISTFGYIGAIAIVVGVFARTLLGGNIPNTFMEWVNLSIEAITVAVTIIVCAVPEGLPMLTSILLSYQSMRMAKDNVLVHKINGLETAGSLSLLFSDKTGTITEGKLSVVEVATGNVRKFSSMKELPLPLKDEVTIGIGLNNSSSYSNGSIIGGNSTDRALMSFLVDAGVDANVAREDVRNFNAFDSAKKYSTVTINHNGKVVTYIKGAPERIIARCQTYLDENGAVKPLTERNFLMTYMDEQAGRSMRLLGVAKCDGDTADGDSLTLVCVLAIRDNVRKEAVDAIREVQEAGIQVVMVTGDRKETAVAIAKEAGDITILDDNFLSIEKAILYGRTMFKSIRKFLIFQLTVNVAAVLTCFLAPLFGENEILTVIQLLVVNLAMDTLAAIAFGSEPALMEYMKEKPIARDASIVTGKMMSQVVVSGLYITAMCLCIRFVPALQHLLGAWSTGVLDTTLLNSAVFATFMMAISFNGFNARTEHTNPFEHLGRNKNFLLVIGALLVLQFLFVTFGGAVLSVEPLSWTAWLVCLLIAFLIIPIDIIRKAITSKKK